MQLYALDKEQRLVYAGKADKHEDYTCLECQRKVRRRGGMHRQTHYYHLNPSDSCRSNNKSMEHLQAQWLLYQMLPKGECTLELPFPAIQRIADVVWDKQKIIFEIQCSPISAQEVAQRNIDYRSQGFQVIWVLHDKRFNQVRVSAAEQVLRSSPYYYTNIDVKGRGKIYDQFDLIHQGMRREVLGQYTVDSTQPFPISALSQECPPLMDARRLWPLFFKGDFMHRYQEDPLKFKELLDKAALLQEGWASPKTSSNWRTLFRRWLVRPYLLVLQMMVERACK